MLYHFADIPGENSIEPTFEIVKQIIKGYGFQFLVIIPNRFYDRFPYFFLFQDEKYQVDTTYTQNERSMLNYKYSSVFFVVQKPL